ncbi:PTS sugar transporter subunit IIB [Desulfovibrio sp. OttesenSCG-928-C06]|nr:PTS sugar transporter subunit IIB [Desulfovibrio sp. OttesenSCG-928-C06]
MLWYRIDNRLIHGQIIEAWLPYTRATKLVVANDDFAAETLRQQIILLAVPSRIHSEFVRVDGLKALVDSYQKKDDDALILFADCADARKAIDSGIVMEACNVGNLHYAPEKRQICPHIALSADDESCLRYLESRGVTLDFRSIPADSPQIKDW